MEGESSEKSRKEEMTGDGDGNREENSNNVQSTSSSAENKITKRNYRRRTDESSSEEMETEEASAEPAVEVNPVDQNENSNGSLDLNFVAAEGENELEQEEDEEEENHTHSSDTDSDDSDFSSPLSPLLRFGLGGRRYRYGDSDSDSTEYDEEVREKANKTTTEIIGKTYPASLHEISWPSVILNRQRGFFCKSTEARYMNHRKVFERNFYGSLNAIERLELMAKLDEHLGCVNCLGFSKNGLYLLSGSDDLRVVLWNWYNQKVVKSVSSKHKKNIFQTKFYEETSIVMKAISASADGTISLHNFTNDGGHTEKQIYTHAGAVHKVALTENTVLSCGEDGLIIEYDFRTKVPQKLITVREKNRKVPLFSITAHPFECKYAISGRDKYVRVFDRRNEKTVLSRHCPNDLLSNNSLRYISCCVYNYNGSELLASFNDENIYLFDASDHRLGSYLHKYTGHINSATIKGVNFFGPRSEFIVTGSDCSYIYFYEKQSESIVQFLRGDENGIVNVLEAHPIYPVLASSGLDKDVKIWFPSNENFELNRESLKKCVNENMRNQYESQNSGASFSVDPSVLELARRFFQRHREVSPNPLAVYPNSSSSDSD